MSRLHRRLFLANLVATAATVRLGLTTGHAQDATPAAASMLPRDVILPLADVQAVVPEIANETATGENATAIGNPAANRSVTFATEDGEHRIVLSVDQYDSAGDAARAFDEAFQQSQDVPGVEAEAVDDLGEGALIGIVTQGDETHVGGGALFGSLIVNATLQAFAGTDENKEKVAELMRKQADHAVKALGLAATPAAG